MTHLFCTPIIKKEITVLCFKKYHLSELYFVKDWASFKSKKRAKSSQKKRYISHSFGKICYRFYATSNFEEINAPTFKNSPIIASVCLSSM